VIDPRYRADLGVLRYLPTPKMPKLESKTSQGAITPEFLAKPVKKSAQISVISGISGKGLPFSSC
jgi:hypothetical protein